MILSLAPSPWLGWLLHWDGSMALLLRQYRETSHLGACRKCTVSQHHCCLEPAVASRNLAATIGTLELCINVTQIDEVLLFFHNISLRKKGCLGNKHPGRISLVNDSSKSWNPRSSWTVFPWLWSEAISERCGGGSFPCMDKTSHSTPRHLMNTLTSHLCAILFEYVSCPNRWVAWNVLRFIQWWAQCYGHFIGRNMFGPFVMDIWQGFRCSTLAHAYE